MLKVFYSWQNDSNTKTNRNFIKDVISESAKQIDFKERIDIDHDTKGVSGIPSITETVFKKIKDSDIFIGDLTFVAGDASTRLISNPNVLIELGYALFTLGESKIILVMNTTHGDPKYLPFDIQHRRYPITYSLDSLEVEDTKVLKEKKNALAHEIANAIQLILETIPRSTPLKPINQSFSYELIYSHLLYSSLADWSEPEITESEVMEAYYLHDVNLRAVFDHSSANAIVENYHEDWVDGFLHKEASSHYVKVYYNNTEILREILVVVDAGNAVMPPIWICNEVIGPGKFFAYKLAEIFDINKNLEQYMEIAKNHLLKNGIRLG